MVTLAVVATCLTSASCIYMYMFAATNSNYERTAVRYTVAVCLCRLATSCRHWRATLAVYLQTTVVWVLATEKQLEERISNNRYAVVSQGKSSVVCSGMCTCIGLLCFVRQSIRTNPPLIRTLFNFCKFTNFLYSNDPDGQN